MNPPYRMLCNSFGNSPCLPHLAQILAIAMTVAIGCSERQENVDSDTSSGDGEGRSAMAVQLADSADEYIAAGPVSARLRCQPKHVRSGEFTEIAVEFRVAPLWEIHTVDAMPPETATAIDLELPNGIETAGDWETPPPQTSLSPAGKPIYAGQFAIRRKVRVTDSAAAGEHQIECRATFQACNEQQCLRPAEIEMETRFVVE